MHASMRAANVFQGASQGIKTMDGHPKNIVCPTPPTGRWRVVVEKTSTTQALSVHCGNMHHALAIANVGGNGGYGCTSDC